VVIRFEFAAADLAGLRFAHSPMAEVVASAFVLRSRSGAYASWRARVDLGAPDFLTPVPAVARPTLDDELRLIAATPPAVAAEQVVAGWAGHVSPSEIVGFAADPRGGLERLVREIRRYFAAAIAPHWARLRSVVEAEISGRARAAAERGPRVLVEGLHPRLGWDGTALLIDYPGKVGEWSLDGHDLALLPTGFAGTEVYAMREGGRALWYGPRGFGNVWAAPSAASWAASPLPALAALLGPTRAEVLTLLAAPHSTGEVASVLGVAAATASHHLTTLRDAGLIVAGRAGRRLLYQRTAMGETLVAFVS
jgi:biotin operon repressor